MITSKTNGDGCVKKTDAKLKKMRVFAKTQASGQKTINDLYMHEIKAK